jgi:hypothetical protein
MAAENPERATSSREPDPESEVGAEVSERACGRRIAELFSVPVSTVSYHLRVARAADPELRPAHEKAAKAENSRVTERGMEQMRRVVAMVEETGRYPSRSAESTTTSPCRCAPALQPGRAVRQSCCSPLQNRSSSARTGGTGFVIGRGIDGLTGGVQCSSGSGRDIFAGWPSRVKGSSPGLLPIR